MGGRSKDPAPHSRPANWNQKMTFLYSANTPSPREAMISRPTGEDSRSVGARNILGRQYDNLKLEMDRDSDTLWCFMQQEGRPSCTHELMDDFGQVQQSIAETFARATAPAQRPFSWFVMGSAVPGIYCLGGDLGLFAQRIRQGDLEALRHYGHVAVKQSTARRPHLTLQS